MGLLRRCRTALLAAAALAAVATSSTSACSAHAEEGSLVQADALHTHDGLGAGCNHAHGVVHAPAEPAPVATDGTDGSDGSKPKPSAEMIAARRAAIVMGNADVDKAERGPFNYDMKGPFFTMEEQFAGFKFLQDNWEAIRAEAHSIHATLDLQRKQYEWGEGAADFARRLVEAENRGWVVSWDAHGGWLNYALVYYDVVMPGVTEEWAPKTIELLRQVPGIRVGGFSRLLPDAYIAPHTDSTGLPYNSLAFHLCLSGHASLRLGEDWVEQRPGKVLIFDTTYDHEVLNGDEERIILYLDFDISKFLDIPAPAGLED